MALALLVTLLAIVLMCWGVAKLAGPFLGTGTWTGFDQNEFEEPESGPLAIMNWVRDNVVVVGPSPLPSGNAAVRAVVAQDNVVVLNRYRVESGREGFSDDAVRRVTAETDEACR